MFDRLRERFRRRREFQTDATEAERLRRDAEIARRAAEARTAEQQARLETFRGDPGSGAW